MPASKFMAATALALVASTALAHDLPDTLIKPLLAQDVDAVTCFAGKFTDKTVNVWDYGRSKMVPVPGLFRSGEQVMRPEPHVDVGQHLTTMTLLLTRDDREHESWDEMHDFRLRISLKGWSKPLESAGECPFRAIAKRLEGSSETIEPNTDALFCGIDCDGGGMSVQRVAGTRDLIFRFTPLTGGLRMSSGCSGGHYHVGGWARPYDDASRRTHVIAEFRLSPMPAKDCAAFDAETRPRD